MGEFDKRAAPLKSSKYVDLMGLTPDQAAYFSGKDLVRGTDVITFTRLVRIAELNYVFPNNGVTTTTLRLQMQSSVGPIDEIYGYVHSFAEPDSSVLEPQYYCTSGYLRSHDGEYRRDIAPMSCYHDTMKGYSSVVNPIINHINKLIADNKITIACEHYGDIVELATLPLYVLAMGWLIDVITALDAKVFDSHWFGNRKQWVTEFPGGGELFTMLKSVPGAAVIKCANSARYPYGDSNRFNAGQKLIPVPVAALARPYDLSHAIWREIYVNELVTVLVMNNICTGFAYLCGWFYINDADANLFSGESMRNKYDHDVVARGIRHGVMGERMHTRDREVAPGGDPRQDIYSPINNYFNEIGARLRGVAEYADNTVVMSDRAICIVAIHVTVPVSNVITLHNQFEPARIDLLGKSLFSGVVFNHLYDLYCLNSRVGAIHGDLHIGNATVYRGVLNTHHKYLNAVTVIGDKFYSFAYSAFNGCIIDFSRAIVGDLDKIARDYSRPYADKIKVSQVYALANLIKMYFPEKYEKYQEDIHLMGLRHFDDFFRTCTILDAYSLFSGMRTMFSVRPEYIAKVREDVRELIQQIVDACVEVFNREFEHLITTSTGPTEWPLLQVITRVFEPWLITWPPPDDAPVGIVVNYNNPIKYDSQKLNPLVDPTDDIRIHEEVGLEYVDSTKGKHDMSQMQPQYQREIVFEDAKKYEIDYDVVDGLPPSTRVGAGVCTAPGCFLQHDHWEGAIVLEETL